LWFDIEILPLTSALALQVVILRAQLSFYENGLFTVVLAFLRIYITKMYLLISNGHAVT
jgi:hypothetical protein